jgi:hypothetical protein
MSQSSAVALHERIVDAMIELARAAKSQRIITGGANQFDMLVELHRRGYMRTTSMRTCRIPCRQFDVALVASGAQPMRDLEATLDRLVSFLGPAGVLVVWVASRESMPDRKLRLLFERLAYRVESGTCCEGGIALCARPIEACLLGKAA